MQKTANQIKSSFELLASGHYQIHSFLYAQEFEQQAYENLIYPLMLVYPLGGSLSGTTYSRNYRVIIADRVLKSEGNELEVESDTQLIALDVLAYWMKLGQNERFTITSSNTITPFWEKWGDEVTGHFVDIGIEEFYDFNSCAIPLSGSIPTPINPCKDARISVNSVVYGNAPSDTNFNVVVKDQLGSLVGSLIGGEWIVNTGGSCADATYTIEDTLGNVLYTGTTPSGGSLTQAIGNSTLNVNNSVGTLISSESILAEGTDSYNVADSVAVIKNSVGTTLKSENILATATENITINDSLVNVRKSDNVLISAVSVKAENTENYLVADSLIENDASSPTYSQLVKATEGLILPTQEIQNNGVASGFIPSVGTINVTTNAAPTSFTITGRTIDIVLPSGGGSYDLDLVDRYGNALPTKQVTANATWDLRTLTPFDWADIYLSRLLTPPSTLIENAIIDLYDDLDAADIFEETEAFYIAITTSAADNSWNLRYPFDNINSGKMTFLGSPSHTTSGIEITGASQGALSNITPQKLEANNRMISMYINQSITDTSTTTVKYYMGALSQTANNGLFMHCHQNAVGSVVIATDSSRTSFGSNNVTGTPRLGLWSTGYNASVRNVRRSGNNIIVSGNVPNENAANCISFGSITLLDGVSVANSPIGVRFPYMRIGSYLAGTREDDHYNAVLTFLTTLGIN